MHDNLLTDDTSKWTSDELQRSFTELYSFDFLTSYRYATKFIDASTVELSKTEDFVQTNDINICKVTYIAIFFSFSYLLTTQEI